MRYLPTLLVAAALAAAPATAAFAADEGGLGVRLIDASTGAETDPSARTYIIEHMPPGTAIERSIEVQNNTGREQSVKIYPGPADVADGQFTVGHETEKSNLSSWTSVPESTLVLNAGETARVPVSITIPADAPEGEEYAVVWAQIQGSGDASAQVSRVGVREYIHVGAGNAPAADFTFSAPAGSRDTEGIPTVTAKVTNTGGRALNMTGELTLSEGPGGTAAGPFAVKAGTTIAPGDSADVSVALDAATPDGPWQAKLSLSGAGTTHEVAGKLTFPEGSAAPESVPEVSPETDPAGQQGALAAAGAGGLLAILLGAAFLILRRRRSKHTPATVEEG